MKAKLGLLRGLFFLFTLFFLAGPALPQRAMTASEVVAFVKSQLALKGDDRATADLLRGVRLTQKLDPRDVEDLQGKGAGVRTLQALRKLSEDSAGLPAAPPPPAPPPVAPPP
jgi:parvulin-like peptidyl-prolyl isomerase